MRSVFTTSLSLLALSLIVGCGGKETATADGAKPWSGQSKKIAVIVAPAERKALSANVELTGSLLPRRVARVTAEVDGVVESIPEVGIKLQGEANGRRYSEQLAITIGQPVKKGDVLVQLRKTDLQLQLKMAQAKLAKAKADMAQLKSWKRPEELQRLTALRNEAKARYEMSIRTHQRLQRLVQRNAVSDSDHEQAVMEVATSRAVLESNEANLKMAKAGPTPEEIAVQQALVQQAEAEVAQKREDLSKTTIRAPFDGVVTQIPVEVGDRVTAASGSVVDLMDLGYLIAEIGVPERYIGKFNVKDRAIVTISGAVSPVQGVIIALNSMVEPQARTFRARVAIDNAQQQFKAGQFAKVLLTAGSSKEEVCVPSRSIVFVEGEPRVFVLDQDRAKLIPVKLGLTNGNTTQILTGLEANQQVITDDPSLLSDGMTVEVETSTATAHP